MPRTHPQIPLKSQHSNHSVCSAWDKGYRFGFNTQEKDDEIAGVGNIYTAEYWEYDSRLGRRWNLDPVDQVWMSNYSVLGNCPIFMVDFFGDDPTPNKYEKKAIKRAQKLSEKYPGYVITIQKGDSNDEFIISAHKLYFKTLTSVMSSQNNNILCEVKFSQKTVGYKEVYTETYKVGRWSKFWSMFEKGNATFSFGVVFTSKNGGNSNKFASVLDPDGKFLTVDKEIMQIFGGLKLKPESNNSVLTRSLNTGSTKDKEAIDKSSRENANTAAGDLEVKGEINQDDFMPGKIEKTKIELNPIDGKLYEWDSVSNKKGWIRNYEPVKPQKSTEKTDQNK